MQVTSKQLAKSLMQSLIDGSDPSVLSKSFMVYLEKNHLTSLLPNILTNLDRELDSHEKKRTAKIEVSHETSATLIKEIENFIKKDPSHKSSVKVESELIGGFKAEYKGRVFDGSVSNYLKELRATLIK